MYNFENLEVSQNDINVATNIPENKLPDEILKQYSNIVNCSKKIKEAEDASNEAKKQQNKANKAVKEAVEEAEKAKDAIENATNINAGIGHKKEAIESLQEGLKTSFSVQQTQAEVQKLQTRAMNSTNAAVKTQVEAITELQNNQKQLADATKYLFVLGMSNIAANRTVVQVLEGKLQNASKEELSDAARKELSFLIDDLKTRQDIIGNQAEIKSILNDQVYAINNNYRSIAELKIKLEENDGIDYLQNERLSAGEKYDKEQDARISAGEEYDAEQDERLDAGERYDKEQDSRISAGEAYDAEQDERLDAGERYDKEQDSRISAGEAYDAEQDERLDAGERYDKEQDSRISAGEAHDAEQDERLDAGEEYDISQDKIINELIATVQQLQKDYNCFSSVRKIAIVSLILSIIAILISIFSFLL